MEQLMKWLPQHLPQDDETTLVHGDYRLDNLVLHATEPRVIGVLDWELSTLGHPLADLAYQCMAWRIPATLWRSEEHTSELQSLMRISYAVFCLTKKNTQ